MQAISVFLWVPRILHAETAAMSMIDRIGFYYDEMAGELHAKHGDDSE